jgi:hypothetical protein
MASREDKDFTSFKITASNSITVGHCSEEFKWRMDLIEGIVGI